MIEVWFIKKKHGGEIRFLNLLAKKVLLEYFLEHFKMEKIDSINGNDAKGKALEKYCQKLDLSGAISIELSPSDLFATAKSLVRYEVGQFDYFEDLEIGEGKKYFKTTLLLTKNPLFPYIDYVIYIPESKKIIFKQITMSTISSHLNKGPLKDIELIKDFSDLYKEKPLVNQNSDPTKKDKKHPLDSVGEVIKFLCYPIYGWVNKGIRPIKEEKKEEKKEKKEEEKKEEKKEEKGKPVCQILLELLFGEITEYRVEISEEGIFKVYGGQKLFDIEIIYVTGTRKDQNVEPCPLKNLLFCFRGDLENLKIPFWMNNFFQFIIWILEQDLFEKYSPDLKLESAVSSLSTTLHETIGIVRKIV